MGQETGAAIARDLEQALGAGDSLVHKLYELSDKWRNEATGFGAVEAILRFMEAHPDLEYGVPGPLVQFAESFHAEGKAPGYREALLASVARSPTYYTVWMLNRLINSEPASAERRALLAAMTEIAADASLKAPVRTLAVGFVEWQAKRAHSRLDEDTAPTGRGPLS
jgi:hypothetical protein